MNKIIENKILVLTPVKNAKKHLERYIDLLLQLTYPREYISLGMLESDSNDGTFAEIQKHLPHLKNKFRKADVWKKDFSFAIPKNTPRWETRYQIMRRSVLAKSRNHLLMHALTDEDWVLWLDVDLIDYNANILETLLQTGKEIIQPNCVKKYGGNSFDLNAWRDNGQLHLHDLRTEGDIVKLHAVGGTMLLVKADLHRDGLIFPPYLYGKQNQYIRKNNQLMGKWQIFNKEQSQGEIETEGLAIMAADMGIECWGMPNLEIKHKDE